MKCPACGVEWEARESRKEIPVISAQEGCIFVAENIRQYSQSAIWLLLFEKYGFERRMPYILTLLGIDEAGKLLKILRGAVKAKQCDCHIICIDRWYSHWAKGPEASEMGMLVVEWLAGIAENESFMVDCEGQLKDADFLNEYKRHLKVLGRAFSRERASMIYVDYSEDSNEWSRFSVPALGVILTDAILLGLLSGIVTSHFTQGRSFSSLSSEIEAIQNCRNFETALTKVSSLSGMDLLTAYKSVKNTDSKE